MYTFIQVTINVYRMDNQSSSFDILDGIEKVDRIYNTQVVICGKDCSSGSPAETLSPLHLPLNDIWTSSHGAFHVNRDSLKLHSSPDHSIIRCEGCACNGQWRKHWRLMVDKPHQSPWSTQKWGDKNWRWYILFIVLHWKS